MVMPSQLSPLVGRAAAKLKTAVAEADLLHCHTLWSPLVSRAAGLARQLGKPYVLAPHGMLDPYSFKQRWLKKRLYLEFIERKTISAATRLIFTACEERDLAEKTFGSIMNAEVVPLGADRLPESREILSERFFHKNKDLRGKSILLFMGRLHSKKRPDILPDVLSSVKASFPNTTLIFAGSGDESYLKSIQGRAQLLGLGDSVRFMGHLSGEAKFSVLAAADVFLLPSHQENFGIAVAEALHAGVPVVLTKNVNIWREVEDANAGIAVTDDDLNQRFASSVIALLSDDKRRAIMSRNAQKLANDAFSWDSSCKRTLKIYEDVLAQARSA
jgi:glycosyltransferase involved in cell wall biosynthesis